MTALQTLSPWCLTPGPRAVLTVHNPPAVLLPPDKKEGLGKINGKCYAFYACINKSVISIGYYFHGPVTRINWLCLFCLSHARVGTFLIKKLFFAVLRAYFLGTLTQL